MITKTKGSYPANEIGKTSKDQRIIRPVDLNKVIDEINDEFAAAPNTLQEITVVGATTSIASTFSGGVSNQNGVIKPYKSYVAFLTQTGTADPVATVFENNLTGFIEWERLDTGEYTGTLPNAFVSNKTWLSINFNIGEVGNEAKASFVTNNVNSVLLYTYEASATIAPATDGFKAYIEIRVYP